MTIMLAILFQIPTAHLKYDNKQMMGRVTGFEPATSNTTNWRSNQLSYTRHQHLIASLQTISKVNTAIEFLLQHPIIIDDID